MPPTAQWRWLFMLALRILLVAAALVLLLLGFFVLPWGHIMPLGAPPIPVQYLDFAHWIDLVGLKASRWQRLYALGLGPAHALVALVATVTTIAMSRPGRNAPWGGFLQLLLLASMPFVHFGTPFADIDGVHPGGGGTAVFAGMLALLAACPGFQTKPNPKPKRPVVPPGTAAG